MIVLQSTVKRYFYAHYDRTQVYGFDRSVSAKAVWADRKAKISPAGLTNGGGSGTINTSGISEEMRAALKGANPNYYKGIEYQKNCQRCVQTYEARRRGYKVTAKPKPDLITPGADNPILWGIECFSNDIKYDFGLKMSEEFLKKNLEEAPEGARYIIYTKWADNAEAHVFIAEKYNGKIYYIDPQTNDENVERYFSQSVDNNYKLFRVDNKNFVDDNRILDATFSEES